MTEPTENERRVTLEAARTQDKAAQRLRSEDRDQEAIEAYEAARDLYAESGLQYSQDSAVADNVMRAIKRCDAVVQNIRYPKAKRPSAAIPRPDCLACGKPLRRYGHDGRTFDDGTPQEWGDYGDNRFCGLTCGWRWACRHAAMSTRAKR